jgi:hypothetical protein
MTLRDTLDRHRGIALGSAVGIILLALIFIVREAMSGNPSPIPRSGFYTIDDGATFFKDDIDLVPPFEYDGKLAVRAQVYDCGGKEIVGYLQRYTPDAKKQIDAANGVGVGSIRAAGTEIKAPLTDDNGWVNANHRKAGRIYAVHCPDGSSNTPQPVMP